MLVAAEPGSACEWDTSKGWYPIGGTRMSALGEKGRMRRLIIVGAGMMLANAGCDSSNPTDPDISSEIESEDGVSIPDAALEAGVRRELAILRGSVDEAGAYLDPTGPLSAADLEELEALRAGDGVSSLVGLEHALNLEALSLPENQISDLSPLSGLTKLRRIDLSGNPLSKVEALGTLPALEILAVSATGIDVADLGDLTALRILDLAENEIDNVSSLSGLLSLERLYLDGNGITDPSPLGALANLEVLDLSANAVASLSGLSGPAAPVALILDDNQVTDLSPLVASGGFAGSHLGLRGNPLSAQTLCDDVPALADSGALVRGVDVCPTDPDADDHEPPFVGTERGVVLAGVDRLASLRATFTNRSDAPLYGNNCGDSEWEWQLEAQRLVADEWEVIYTPPSLTCLNPQVIVADDTIEFVRFTVGSGWATGTYRLVWPHLRVGEDSESELAPLGQRISAEFSVVAP
jgi:hypothetical protein